MRWQAVYIEDHVHSSREPPGLDRNYPPWADGKKASAIDLGRVGPRTEGDPGAVAWKKIVDQMRLIDRPDHRITNGSALETPRLEDIQVCL